MADEKIQINRPLVGLITVGCFIAAGLIWHFRLDDRNGMWLGGFVRVGILMSTFWLALPTKTRPAAWARVSPWTFFGIILAAFLSTRIKLPVLIPLIAVIVAASFVLKPRAQRPRRNTTRR